MIDTSVIDASPIILYGRIDRLDLFDSLAGTVIVPDSVIVEVKKGAGKDDTVETALQWAEKHHRDDVSIPDSIEHWDLGRGENQVLSMCLKRNCLGVLDDRMARRCAKAHDISMTGSLGIILKARRAEIVSEASPWVHKLIDAGLYLDPSLVGKALRAVGEEDH